MVSPSTIVRAFPNELKLSKEIPHAKSTITKYQVNDHSRNPTEYTSADFKSAINDLIAQGSFSREEYMRLPRQPVSQITPLLTKDKT